MNASDMLICGEDLGMIPKTVPEVMRELNIIPLEIQRMPKGPSTFGNPGQYDYLSVCSPSCHDMSTIRGWWEENPEIAQKFFYDHWNKKESMPENCTTDIVRGINVEHLHSPSIMAIFPIQDLLGMDEDLRREKPEQEQINNPANPENYWRYRIHIPLDDLNKEEAFLDMIRNLVKDSGR
jgi:4-alpha-glucanotransferase